MTVKRIGVLTSGGDAPGMNAAIRAVVRSANTRGIEVYGIRRGWNGLINDDMDLLTNRDVGNIMNRGGTVLYTARSDEFRTLEGRKKAYDNCVKRELDAIVAIGGDGTFAGCLALSREYPIKVVGIPATIDNDIGCSHYSLGYDTAANTAIDAIDKIRDTMQSHERCSVIEVMGHRSGKLAMYVGIATGATAVLIPEQKWNYKRDIEQKIKNYQDAGFTHYMIVVAEGAINTDEDIEINGSVGQTIVDLIKKNTIFDPRLTVLGHVQRGGTPGARDRVTATRMGCHAVKVLLEGKDNRVIVHKDGKITDIDMEEGLRETSRLDRDERYIIKEMTGKCN